MRIPNSNVEHGNLEMICLHVPEIESRIVGDLRVAQDTVLYAQIRVRVVNDMSDIGTTNVNPL